MFFYVLLFTLNRLPLLPIISSSLAGERNDLKVRVELFTTDFELEDSYDCFDTDVHFFSRRTATFNWRILKRVKLPLAAMSAKVRTENVM